MSLDRLMTLVLAVAIVIAVAGLGYAFWMAANCDGRVVRGVVGLVCVAGP